MPDLDPFPDNAESRRMADDPAGWRRWGPYVSDRQWGTVREDTSADGDAWNALPHDHARSRAYRWGEDGIAGFSDERQRLCLALALWNGRDPILKERLFGLSNAEGNHGEDVKELYHYLDGVPSHAYMRMLYKYPQRAFPYADLVETNARRQLGDREYELFDTGVFDENRYFDVEVEYAKAAADDIVLQVTATNRGPEDATLWLLPQLYARNRWSWKPDQPRARFVAEGESVVRCTVPDLPPMSLHCEGAPALVFCENDTNRRRFGESDAAGWFKDGIGEWLVHGDEAAVNPAREGTKLAAVYRIEIAAGAAASVRVLLGPTERVLPELSLADIVARRRAEADAWYAAFQRDVRDEDARRVQRQALAGLLWSKQYYEYDVREWLADDARPPAPSQAPGGGRNAEWTHLTNGEVLSVPDKWEYPWYAAWDLAFHCVGYALIDPSFAKEQLTLLTQSRYMHPNGQLPAYEWAFGDVNPPVHAWAAFQVYMVDRERTGVADTDFLERIFHKLLLNFAWWINRKDADGRNIFQGGFLGLDNIGLFDRSKPLPTGGTLDQTDGTAWVSAYALNLLRIALELAVQRPVYEDLATKFFEHFLYIAEAMHGRAGDGVAGLWDEDDGFYYDVLRRPGEPDTVLRLRSLVGLIPLLAVEVMHGDAAESQPAFKARLEWFLTQRPDLARVVANADEKHSEAYRLLALMRSDRLKRVLGVMFDEAEFLSPHGIRSLSKYHEAHPIVFAADGAEFSVRYAPGESDSRAFGGNSNWRGPVWLPLNMLIVQALHKYHVYYGDDFRVEFPTGSGHQVTLHEAAELLTGRLQTLFLRDADGRRTCFADDERQQSDPHFRDHLLFHEYFDGDTGRGCGASHQTGWTGLVALLLMPGAASASVEATARSTPVTPAGVGGA